MEPVWPVASGFLYESKRVSATTSVIDESSPVELLTLDMLNSKLVMRDPPADVINLGEYV
jgi:hypothetical protein